MAHAHNHDSGGTVLPIDIEGFDTTVDCWVTTEMLKSSVPVPCCGGKQTGDANQMLGHRAREGTQGARKVLEDYQQLYTSTTLEQAWNLNNLARLLLEDKQLDAAKEAVSQAIDFAPREGQYLTCDSHRLHIYHSKGERARAIHHYGTALVIAAAFNWRDKLCWTYYAITWLFLNEGEFKSVQTHTEKAKLHTANLTYSLGRAMELQAVSLYKQGRLREAKSEASHAFETFETAGNTDHCKVILQTTLNER